MDKLVCVQDFKALAKRKCSQFAFEYCDSEGGNGVTRKDNCEAFLRYKIRPHILNDVSKVDLSTSLLGERVSFPVCVAPTGLQKLFHDEGELESAKAAAELGTGFVMSFWSTTPIEHITNNTKNFVKWFQIHVLKDRSWTVDLIRRAEKSGCNAIVLTVDYAVVATRYGDIRKNFIPPSTLNFPNLPVASADELEVGFINNMIDPSSNWSDVVWIKSITKLPLLLKGVVSGAMAKKAVEYGVDGIMVSNHGGRQLDCQPATIDVLQEVVKAVDGKCDVFLDGGIRCGTDVLKAIALGAKAVFVGRPVVWGLACNGSEGVKQVLTILRDEFKIAMQLAGFASIPELQAATDVVVPASYYYTGQNSF